MYATRADIEASQGEFLSLIDERVADGHLPADAVDRALKSASDLIDAHIGARYRLPLAAAVPMLTRPAVDIAVHDLAGTADYRTDIIRERYEDAIGLLKRIGDGKASLNLDTDSDGKGEARPSPIVVTGPDRMFSRKTLREL
jgi:phage gp36-like protein